MRKRLRLGKEHAGTVNQKAEKRNSEAPGALARPYMGIRVLNFDRHDSATDVLRKIVMPELKKRGLDGTEFPEVTLSRLYEVILNKELIHYFNETSQEIDHVLDVFIRTNSGGTQLAFSDLLISIAIAHWDGDFPSNSRQDSRMSDTRGFQGF